MVDSQHDQPRTTIERNLRRALERFIEIDPTDWQEIEALQDLCGKLLLALERPERDSKP